MKKWFDLDAYGIWGIEKILITFDIPLLFVCQNSQRMRYLVLCIDEENGVYLACRINKRILLNMLTDKCTMRSVFEKGLTNECLYIAYSKDVGKFTVKEIDNEELEEDWLPDAGAYLELRNHSIQEYIARLNRESVELRQGYRHEEWSGAIESRKRNINYLCEKYNERLLQLYEQLMERSMVIS